MIRFGVIGAGNIAHKFAQAVKQIPEASIVSVCGKDPERVQKWAAEEDISAWYTSAATMLSEENLDAVYIATTNNFHVENIRTCLLAGKHVLCEKPMAMTEAAAREVISLARSQNCFLMEGMWTRFLPKSQVIKDWISSGRIGKVQLAQATIGFTADPDPEGRLYNPLLGGGALYDLGVYPIELLPWYINEEIQAIQSDITLSGTGIDKTVNMNLRLDNCDVNIQCSICTKLPEDGYIYGEQGYIHIPKIHMGTAARLYDAQDRLVEEFDSEPVNGFIYEVEEVIRCITQKQIESKIAPHSMTLKSCAIYDECLGCLRDKS